MTRHRRPCRWALVLAILTLPPIVFQTSAAALATVEVFTRPGCEHCAHAEEWLRDLRSRRPELRVIEYDVQADPAAREELRRRAKEAGLTPAVPAFVIGERMFVGFAGAATTGAALEAVLDGATGPVMPDRLDLPVLGEVTLEGLGLPLFTLVVGLLDGFNPCAMWVLLFLLSLLVNLRSRRKMALVGGAFVAVSGVAYFAFMSAWLSVFLAIGAARWLQVGLGAMALVIGAIHVKDALAPRVGPSLSIPASAKPGIYARVRRIVYAENLRSALVATVVLAVAVNLIELMCTAGLPAIYTQILVAQRCSTPAYYAYLVLYVLAYVFDDALMLGFAVATLSRRKLQERAGQGLQFTSGALIFLLGLALIFTPERLAFSP